jgi:hypothetical protein
MYCGDCGTEFGERALFCSGCGRRVPARRETVAPVASGHAPVAVGPVVAPSLSRQELTAALHARHELGERLEPEVVDSFLSQVEQAIDARVEGRLRGRLPSRSESGTDVGGVWLALGSFGMGIPLTAIAAGTTGFSGLVAAWAGIAVVNLAYHQRRKN